MNTSPAAGASVSPEISEIEAALTEITYLASRARQHERLMAIAGVSSLDRSAAALLRHLADVEPVRIGELAARLSVEASHVTRQVQHLEKAGYATRVPDPDDGRAQRIQLTEAGRDVVERIRKASCLGMRQALDDWSAEDLHQLSVLFRRLVGDFIEHAEDEVTTASR
jgi:DNA-binding MarR family transcriptional regulator